MTLPSPPSDPSQLADTAPLVRRVIELETPFGRPLDWAELAMVTDIGDSHELNDDRCLIVTSKDLGARATGPLSDFLLCVLADGASGSTFGPRGSSMESGDPRTHAGWRASQLAQAVFVERFLSSPEVDLLDRLKDGLRTADSELVESVEGNLSTTLTALVLTADGTAYAASIGDSVLLVLPPRRGTGADRRFKKLGYEETTSVGSGDTTLSNVDENDLIEQWWPNKEGGRASTRLAPGTFLMLVTDGISDNLPAETVDHLLHRHPLDRATIALPLRTRERRAQTQHSGGGSTHQLGLDNMSAIVVRYHGRRAKLAAEKLPRLAGATLMTLMGTHGGPTPSSGGQFGMICLAGQENGATALPGFIRNVLTTEYEMDASDLSRLDDGARDLADGASDPSKRWRGLTDSADPSKRSRGRGDGALDFSARMNTAFVQAMPTGDQSHLTVLALDEHGREHTFSSGWVEMDLLPVRISERSVAPARDSALQRLLYTPKLWASTLASLAMLVLVTTAFANGAMRPSPPPAPTLPPGQPTPTPDTRPALSFGGFQLVPPAAPATDSEQVAASSTVGSTESSAAASVPSSATSGGPAGDAVAPEPAAANPDGGSPPAADEPTVESPPPPCRNVFGLFCSSPPPPIRRAPPPAPKPQGGPTQSAPPAAPTEDAPLAVPSPAPATSPGEAAPRPGSNLDAALKIASMASDQFNRSLEDPSGR